MEKELKGWQIHLAFWGGLFWLASFPLLQFSNEQKWQLFSLLLSGYILGAVTSFSGFAIKQILIGNLHRFIEQSPIFKPVSIFSLFIILLIGLFGLISTNWIQVNDWYNATFILGSIVAGWGIVPFINFVDENY